MKKKIFVVDDDSDIRRLIRHQFQQDFDLEEFSHWQDVKRRLVKGLPHLFILDVMYSDSTIIEFLKYRSLQMDIKKVPVIIFSSLKNKKIINQVLTYDISEYIIKPFNPKLLSNAIQRVFFDKKNLNTLKDQDLFDLEMPIYFHEVSEISMLAETDVRLVEGEEYHIHAEFFDKYELPTDNLFALQNSNISENGKKFITSFRVRGASEKFLEKVRVVNRK